MPNIAYEISEADQQRIFESFPPKYSALRGHHVTFALGKTFEDSLPPEADIEIIGYAHDGNGIEALVVAVNGDITRPDGGRFHITLSFDPDKLAPASFDFTAEPGKRTERPYRSLHSNALIEVNGYQSVAVPFVIRAEAKFHADPAPQQPPQPDYIFPSP